ncbi:MAG: ABC transporter substrate-binding protein [Nitriliruptorales bacterium]|nr:ABC transporter substrate-binding protein [Nitriliruptorales bacterium]
MSTTFRDQVILVLASLLLLAGVITVLDRPDGNPVSVPVVDEEPTSPDDPSATPADPDTATPDAGASPSPGASAGPTDGPSEPGGPPPTTPTVGPSAPPTDNPGTPPPDADLYVGADNTRGITDDLIRMCGHAALTLAAAFDTSEADLSVYWEQLSDNGGIHGRDVELTWEDDAYSADQAVTAATACADKDPFLILGGIGFDQIPGARNWAEQNKELYLHHIAVRPENPTYSFSLQPTVQQSGKAFGEYLASTYRNESIGIIYRNSPNWDPGRQAGVTVLEQHGIQPTQAAVQANQGAYGVAINQVRNSDVVWVWENALNAANIIIQAESQGVRPRWVVFPFQTTLDLLDDANLNPTIDGVATWPSYAPGGYGNDWSQFGLSAEIARFEAAYAQYRPNTTTNDILFQVWVGNKVLHELLLRCGADCTRNRFAGLLEAGLQLRINPACAIDTTGPSSLNGRLGGHEFVVQRTFGTGNNYSWESIRWCSRSLL